MIAKKRDAHPPPPPSPPPPTPPSSLNPPLVMLHGFWKALTQRTLLSNCSLRDETNNFTEHASRILLLRVFSGALVSTYQTNSCLMFLGKCFQVQNSYRHHYVQPSYFTISNCFTDIYFSTRTNIFIYSKT